MKEEVDKYTIQVGEIFTKQKANELKEFLELKDKDTKRSFRLIDRKLLRAIPLLTSLAAEDVEIKEAQKILLKLTDLVEAELQDLIP